MLSLSLVLYWALVNADVTIGQNQYFVTFLKNNLCQPYLTHTGASKPERKTWVIVNGQPDSQKIKEHDLVSRVVDQQTKDLIDRLGEITKKLVEG